MGVKGKRVDLQTRQQCQKLVQEAVDTGARRAVACDILGISVRTMERWRKLPNQGDLRAGPIHPALHCLTEEEKIEMLKMANLPENRDLCPWKLVAKLADFGIYLASESSFYRVLRELHLIRPRLTNVNGENRRPKHLRATAPNQVWSWDITYLKSPVNGLYYYLYLMIDIFSRKIVGWRIEDKESRFLAAEFIKQTCIENKIGPDQLTIHSDNGNPMKGSTMTVTLANLKVTPSLSRPQVSNDNAYSESLFKTLKYRPSFPDGVFASIEESQLWATKFVQWYNDEHLHSGIKYITPSSRHAGTDTITLANRHDVYQLARLKTPTRWSGKTRNWNPITEVHLNPKKEDKSIPKLAA